MGKNFDKVLVAITASVFIAVASILFLIDIVCPKKIDNNFGLSFGDANAKVKVVVFEDFKCTYCKKLSNYFFPPIKEKYLETDKISYNIIPLAFICGSKQIANAAISIYELNKDQFFNFVEKISQENVKLDTKEDLINIVKDLPGINIEIFKELLDKEVFNDYLEDNLILAKSLMRRNFQVPTIFVNGHQVPLKKLDRTINEYISKEESK